MSGQPKRRQVVERLESLGGIEWLCEQIKALLDTADEQSTAAIRKARFRADYRKWYASALVDRYQRFKFLLPVLLLAGCASDEQVTRRGWELVWADEFDGTLIDQDSWTPLVMPDPHNEELQYYTDRVDAELGANVWLADGALVIEARRKDFEHRRYTSARLNTRLPAGDAHRSERGGTELVLKVGMFEHLQEVKEVLLTQQASCLASRGARQGPRRRVVRRRAPRYRGRLVVTTITPLAPRRP